MPPIIIRIPTNKEEYRQASFGALLVILGTMFLLDELRIWNFDWDDFWPILLIFVGFLILRNGIFGSKKVKVHVVDLEGELGHSHFGKTRPMDTDVINISAVLGGGGYKFTSRELTAGKITAIMGGAEVDLTNADIKGDTLVLDLFAFWGGIELKVPNNWIVVNELVPFLGGVDDETSPPVKANKKVIIRGSAIMGGVEVFNVIEGNN